ncbi:MAG: peptidoglycan-binding protein [Ruminococcus sp.]|nr:peptidoglycan-binding protein [Ruminococcus sp.]
MGFSEKQKREHISEIQRYLGQIQLLSGDLMTVFPNGVYGDRTRAAVRDFQQDNGLPITGEIDSDTWNKITAVYIRLSRITPDAYQPFYYSGQKWQKGDVGLPVWVIQSMFQELGKACDNIPPVSVSGEFMDDMEEAVRFFRKKCGLPDDCVVDRDTWNMLVGCCRHFR